MFLEKSSAKKNWLKDDGVLSFLMPRELSYQASYNGWLQSVGGDKRDFIEFHDWSNENIAFFIHIYDELFFQFF